MTSSAQIPKAPLLRRESALVGKKTFRFTGDASDHFATYQQAWNCLVQLDRRGKLHDQADREHLIGKTFGKGNRASAVRPIIEAAIKAYLKRRAKSKGPLRRKSLERVKSIPAVGPLKSPADAVLRTQGVNLRNVINRQIRRSCASFVLMVTLKKPLGPDRKEIARRHYERVKNRGRVTYASVANTPNGTDILIVNNPQKWNARRKVDTYHLPLEVAVQPEVVEIVYQALFSNTHMVTLDESMLPSLSGPMRDANTRWRRYGRRQQAAGATDFAMASPVWQEAQDTVEFAKTVGFYPEDLRGVLWDARRSFVLKCPHCGAPVSLKLDPHTQVPLDGTVACSECHVAVRVGILLGTRALTLCMDDWFHYGDTKRPQGLDHRKVAPSRQTTTKNETRKTRGSVPHRGRAELRT